MMQQLLQAKPAGGGQRGEHQAAQEEEPPTTTAGATQGCRQKRRPLALVKVLRQLQQQLEDGISKAAALLGDDDLEAIRAGDQRFLLAWAR